MAHLRLTEMSVGQSRLDTRFCSDGRQTRKLINNNCPNNPGLGARWIWKLFFSIVNSDRRALRSRSSELLRTLVPSTGANNPNSRHPRLVPALSSF